MIKVKKNYDPTVYSQFVIGQTEQYSHQYYYDVDAIMEFEGFDIKKYKRMSFFNKDGTLVKQVVNNDDKFTVARYNFDKTNEKEYLPTIYDLSLYNGKLLYAGGGDMNVHDPQHFGIGQEKYYMEWLDRQNKEIENDREEERANESR